MDKRILWFRFYLKFLLYFIASFFHHSLPTFWSFACIIYEFSFSSSSEIRLFFSHFCGFCPKRHTVKSCNLMRIRGIPFFLDVLRWDCNLTGSSNQSFDRITFYLCTHHIHTSSNIYIEISVKALCVQRFVCLYL